MRPLLYRRETKAVINGGPWTMTKCYCRFFMAVKSQEISWIEEGVQVTGPLGMILSPY
jgi:hypothetical protein